jgi:hypothetical protein
MSKIKLLFVFLMTFGTTVLFAQGSERKVSKIEAGTVLTQDDVAFLTLVSGTKVSKTNPVEISSAKVAGEKYKVGQSLSQSDADKLNAAIADYSKSNVGVNTPSEADNTPPTTNARKLKKNKNGLTYCLCCYYWYQNPYNGLWYQQWYWCWI